ncbi:MAG: MOSC domain-containing protein [Candidatus Omnitrophota bacterium]
MPGIVFSLNLSQTKGVPKHPVPHICLKMGLGAQGDAHFGSGLRQVSLLAWEDICRQQACARAKKRGARFMPGDFAENITTLGIDLSGINIGDRIIIGEKAVLRVSQIGKECHNYCHIYKTLGNCIMPKRGIFARVLRGGMIRPDDKILLQEKSA